jgi:hypothetical protein
MVWTVILRVEDPESPGSLEFWMVSEKSVAPGETVGDVGEEEGDDCCAKERAQYWDPELDFKLVVRGACARVLSLGGISALRPLSIRWCLLDY